VVLIVVVIGAKEVTACESRSGDAIDNFLMLELYSYGMICAIVNSRQFEREVSEQVAVVANVITGIITGTMHACHQMMSSPTR
jgi:energy-converting hydrogenase Eha subunit C